MDAIGINYYLILTNIPLNFKIAFYFRITVSNFQLKVFCEFPLAKQYLLFEFCSISHTWDADVADCVSCIFQWLSYLWKHREEELKREMIPKIERIKRKKKKEKKRRSKIKTTGADNLFTLLCSKGLEYKATIKKMGWWWVRPWKNIKMKIEIIFTNKKLN